MSWSHRPSDLGHHFILSPQNVVSSLIKKYSLNSCLYWSYYEICDSCITLIWNLKYCQIIISQCMKLKTVNQTII